MPRPLLRSLIAAVLVLSASACDPGPGPSGGGESPSPSPEPGGYTTEILNQRARLAALTDRDFARVVGPGTLTTEDGQEDLQPCDADLVADEWTLSGFLNEWTSPGGTPEEKRLTVNQYTVGFWRDHRVLRAADVIAEIRARATCTTYDEREATQQMLGPLPLPVQAGVDGSYAFCERIQPGARGSCTFYLAVGEILSKVRVVAASEGVAKEFALSLLGPAVARMAQLR